jgi:hypothetical protein
MHCPISDIPKKYEIQNDPDQTSDATKGASEHVYWMIALLPQSPESMDFRENTSGKVNLNQDILFEWKAQFKLRCGVRKE